MKLLAPQMAGGSQLFRIWVRQYIFGTQLRADFRRR